MKITLILIIVASLILALASCNVQPTLDNGENTDPTSQTKPEDKKSGSQNEQKATTDGEGSTLSGADDDENTTKDEELNSSDQEESLVRPEFKMKAEVVSLGEKIEVNVYEAEYADGIFLLITDEKTGFRDALDAQILRSDISVGDHIEITYSGQVMMSYPPQVYAIKIQKIA